MKFQNLLPISIISLAVFCAGMPASLYAGEETDQELERIADQYNDKQTRDGAKVVCAMETQTGSRFKTKVCRTVATVERQSKEGKKYLDRVRISVGDQD